MAHSHDHHHEHHHGHVGKLTSLNGIFVFSIILNLLFVGVEAIVGLTQNSLSLLSDAGHNLSDVFSLLLVLIAFHLAKVHASKQYTYGYKKSTVLISLVNAILLLVAMNGVAVSWTAGIGILINGLTVVLLMKGQKEDINVRGAFLHMVADTLVSVGVVISGILITFTGWNIIDPIVSIIIAIIILISTWLLLTSSLRLLVDGIPEGVKWEKVEEILKSHPHVQEVHHIHIWAISTTDNALTAHIVIDDLNELEEVKEHIKHALPEANISHSTLEFETPGGHCHDHECDTC